MLYDTSQKEIWADIISIIKASPASDEISKIFERKMEIENIQQQLKIELKGLKLNLALKLKTGIKV